MTFPISFSSILFWVEHILDLCAAKSGLRAHQDSVTTLVGFRLLGRDPASRCGSPLARRTTLRLSSPLASQAVDSLGATRPPGLEPGTPCFEGMYSIPLSYWRNFIHNRSEERRVGKECRSR